MPSHATPLLTCGDLDSSMACNSDDSMGCCTGKKAAVMRLFDITKHSISSLHEMREAVRKKIPDLCLRKEHLSDQDLVFYDVHRRTQPSRKHERFAFGNPIPPCMNNNNALKQEGGWDSSPQVGDTNSAKPETDIKETPFLTRLKELEKLKMRTIASDQRRRHSFSYFRKTMPYHVRRTSLESCNESENGTNNHHHRHPHNPSDDKTTFSYDTFARDPQSWPSVSSSSPEAGEEAADLSKLIERVLKLRQQQPPPAKLTKPRKPRMGCYMPRRRTGIGVTHRGLTTTVKKDADPLELLNSEANRKKTAASAASSEALPRKRSPKKPQNEDMMVKQGRKRSKSVKRRTVLNVAPAKA